MTIESKLAAPLEVPALCPLKALLNAKAIEGSTAKR
jgi:hypothetical protein